MKVFRYLVLAVLPLSVAACGPGGLTRADGGALIGALTGAAVGSHLGGGLGRVAATAAGAVVGGIVGSEIGRALDEQDRRHAMDAEYQALEYGQSGAPVPWRNSRSGHYGRVVPRKPYKVRNVYCREYTHTIYVDGQPRTLTGRACREPDGTWRSAN